MSDLNEVYALFYQDGIDHHRCNKVPDSLPFNEDYQYLSKAEIQVANMGYMDGYFSSLFNKATNKLSDRLSSMQFAVDIIKEGLNG